MNILLVGSGAREHAIARAILRSSKKIELFCCGSTKNPGIVPLVSDYWAGPISDCEQILQRARQWQVDMAIIGPEAPLEQGLSDLLWEQSIATIGPKKNVRALKPVKFSHVIY